MVLDNQAILLSVRIKSTLPSRKLPINILDSLLAQHSKITLAMSLIIGSDLTASHVKTRLAGLAELKDCGVARSSTEYHLRLTRSYLGVFFQAPTCLALIHRWQSPVSQAPRLEVR